MTVRPSKSPRFPYTTLFRSGSVCLVADRSSVLGDQILLDQLLNLPFGQPADVSADEVVHTDAADIQKVHLRHQLSVSRPRSEEHTSELQSRRDIVCRLLREK